MRRGTDFGAAVRSGRRVGTGSLVVHVLRSSESFPARVGFVVSRAVGGAVIRNRTKRRLGEAVRPLLPDLPPGLRMVVRANRAAASASTAILARDVARGV